jgi:predicted metal-dependent enzyme (double-stranded beta helix superfamily)
VNETPAISPAFDTFIAQVEALIDSGADERALTEGVAVHLSEVLASPLELPPEFTKPHPDRYVMYPLHIDADSRFSVAAAVWDVGQKTPVHSHETWGVVGIYSGIEGESRYVKPLVDGEPLVLAESGLEWGPGQVSVCCVRDDDVHMVACVGDAPCVGIHVYGTDLGTLSRRAYDPATGEVRWFISQWEPVAR